MNDSAIESYVAPTIARIDYAQIALAETVLTGIKCDPVPTSAPIWMQGMPVLSDEDKRTSGRIAIPPPDNCLETHAQILMTMDQSEAEYLGSCHMAIFTMDQPYIAQELLQRQLNEFLSIVRWKLVPGSPIVLQIVPMPAVTEPMTFAAKANLRTAIAEVFRFGRPINVVYWPSLELSIYGCFPAQAKELFQARFFKQAVEVAA